MGRAAAALSSLLGALFVAVAAFGASTGVSVGPVTDLSASCSSQNAEVEQDVDRSQPAFVYEVWMGCQGIGFARSSNGGTTFSTPTTLPGSAGSTTNTWDPTVAAGPNGAVYVAFMVSKGAQYYPVVVASHDHGATFPQVTPLVPPDPKNWGDRPFLAVDTKGVVYVTWDYAPERTSIVYSCPHIGSCAFTSGELNIVLQKSSDGGKSFGKMVRVSPGYPAGGADTAPLVIDPTGRLDLLYQDYATNPTTHALGPGINYFTASADGGATWSTPVPVGASAGTMATTEWWIEPSIGIDDAGNLYAAWDTQGSNTDTGWLSYSTDGGTSWSAPNQATPDQTNMPHIMQVVGGGPGIAYVGWLSDSDPRGYALYLRPFSTGSGWSATRQVSSQFGNPTVWPGDTFGLSTLDANDVLTSWGSAAAGKKSDIFAAKVSVTQP